MDRRIESRLDLQLTCYVGTEKVQAEPLHALTENISRSGLLMRWMEGAPLPEIDKKLLLDVRLPENSEFGPRVMRCRSQVVRISKFDGASHAVALKILSIRFVKPRQAAKGRDLASMPVVTKLVI
jgi:c-di-GMP-binding flagellar brake protein YcgR